MRVQRECCSRRKEASIKRLEVTTQTSAPSCVGCYEIFAAAILAFSLITARATEPESDAEKLSLELHNPVAALISVPVLMDWDFEAGPARAMSYEITLKPVVPFRLSEDWNLISRTVIPFIYSESPVGIGGSRAGLSDLVATMYLSPEKPIRYWYWGVGPGLIFPSATSEQTGAGRWCAGPTAAVLLQKGGWTAGALTGHAWSFAGNSNRDEVSTTHLEPLLSYTTSRDTTFGVDTVSEYDWVGRQWTVPVEASISQVVHLAGQEIEIGLTGRYYADHSSLGPHWGLGVSITFAFPKATKES